MSKRVRDLMTQEVSVMERNDELRLADDVMNLGRIRHLPIVDEDGELVGIVSQRDLFRSALARALGYGSVAQDKIMSNLVIKDVMTTQVETVDADSDLADAAHRMFKQKIGCLVAVEGNKPVGILTEADFVRYVAERERTKGE